MKDDEVFQWLQELKEKYAVVGAPTRYGSYIDRLLTVLAAEAEGTPYQRGYSAGFDSGYHTGFQDGIREVQ